jgi:hypothetical protein
MGPEPQEEWQNELEATAGYEHRHALQDRALNTRDENDWNAFHHWMRTVTWPAELAVWKKAGEWYAADLRAMSPRRRAALPHIVVRCPRAGCLLGTVYEFRRVNAQRFYFVGKTSSGRRQHGMCNWAFADSWDGLDRWWQVGCKHGHVKLFTSDLIEAAMPPPPTRFKVEMPIRLNEEGKVIASEVAVDRDEFPVEYRNAWRAGVFIPPPNRWMSRGSRS